jgi:hypothetical protein
MNGFLILLKKAENKNVESRGTTYRVSHMFCGASTFDIFHFDIFIFRLFQVYGFFSKEEKIFKRVIKAFGFLLTSVGKK